MSARSAGFYFFIPLAFGCATVSTEADQKEAWQIASPAERTLPPNFNPVRYANQFPRPQDCERGARALQSISRDAAWSTLQACIAKGNFLLLREITSAAWMRDLESRPDAPRLLSHVIAMRGGSIESDLAILHARHIPFFTLRAGLAQPEVYKGQFVLVRATVEEIRGEGGQYTAKLQERGLASVGWDAPIGVGSYSRARTHGSGDLDGRFTVGSGRGAFNFDTERTEYKVVRKYDNLPTVTGREALVRLPNPDPFLEPGREFVVLARFDGVRMSAAGEDEDSWVPMLTMVAYEEPNSLVVY